MKKVIKLTETDLTRIVRKVISEQALPEYDFENLKPGKLVQGDKNGKGVLKWSNAKYYGELKNGLMDGKGSLYIDYVSFKRYEKGQFKNNRQNGPGEFKDSYGTEFKGNFKDGYVNGYGEYKYSGGGTFKGNFKDSAPHGYGIETWSDGKTFKGNYKDGYRNGYGEYINPDGSSYKGNYKDGYRNGYGEIKYSSGRTYKGNFKDDLMHGQGIETWNNGTTYKGNYKDGLPNGYGEIIKPDGSSYKGNYKDDSANGYGEYKFPNGSIYKGNFKDSFMDGYGIYTNLHGIKFEGQFKDGRINGKGVEELDKIKTQPKEPSKQQPKTIKLPNLSDKNYYTLEGDKSWVYTKLDDGKWYASKNKIDWYDITNNRKAVETLNKSAKITNIEDTKLQPTVEPTPNLTTTDPNKAKMSRYSPTSDLETGTDIINNMRNKGKIQSIDKTFDKKLGI